jgi:hypothetical protein
MTDYGKQVISDLVTKWGNYKIVIATIKTSGCNAEVVRYCRYSGYKVVTVGTEDGFEIANIKLAQTADKLVVVEGGKNSGTILAAKCFLDLGKDVYAVPGRINDENSWICNYLISNGAGVIGDWEDIKV